MVCSPASEEPVYCEDKLDKVLEDAINGKFEQLIIQNKLVYLYMIDRVACSMGSYCAKQRR
jgi:hypothetical protein